MCQTEPFLLYLGCLLFSVRLGGTRSFQNQNLALVPKKFDILLLFLLRFHETGSLYLKRHGHGIFNVSGQWIFFPVKMCGLCGKPCPVSSVNVILDRVLVSPRVTCMPIIYRGVWFSSSCFQALFIGLVIRQTISKYVAGSLEMSLSPPQTNTFDKHCTKASGIIQRNTDGLDI